MNTDALRPIVLKIVGSLVRMWMMPVVLWMVTNGIITEDQTAEVLALFASILAGTAWVIYKNVREMKLLNTAAATASPVSVKEVEHLVKTGVGAPVLVATSEKPSLGTGPGQ